MQNPKPIKSASGIVAMPTIPAGFTAITGPDDKEYVVPVFMVPALNHALLAYREKRNINVESMMPSLLQVQDWPFDELAAGMLKYPPDPPLSKQERLSIHAEIIALQLLYGISYKDATHRLYIAEIKKAEVADKAVKSLHAVSVALENILGRFKENSAGLNDTNVGEKREMEIK